VLVECAWAAVRHDGYLKALYHRHVMKWGGYRSPLAKNKAIIVVAHALLANGSSLDTASERGVRDGSGRRFC
jgi:hypothetical protein